MPVQQRLFTGALFSEEINAKLSAFAQRHKLTSNVWVPRNAFDLALLQPYGVTLSPTASLCDTLIAGEPGEPRNHRALVNASQTSHPQLLEVFRELMVPVPSFVAASQQHKMYHPPTFSYPLTKYGTFISNATTVARLQLLKTEMGAVSNYWLPDMPCNADRRYTSVEATKYPGRFNPMWCVHYMPHTFTQIKFPHTVSLLMKQRAVTCGYVSRTWLTRAEGEQRFGMKLCKEREQDGPPVWCNAFSGGMQMAEYFCADQFEGSDAVMMSTRELDLAVKGVSMPLSKLRGFPTLAHAISGGEQHHYATAPSTTAATAEGSRAGADLSMHDAARHIHFQKILSELSTIRLLGRFQYVGQSNNLLKWHHFEEKLRNHTLLCGFPTPLYINTQTIYDYDLRLRRGEQGVLQPVCPVKLWSPHVYLRNQVWYNFSQLEEPEVALLLLYKRPIHFMLRYYIKGPPASMCCRVLLTQQYTSSEWMPHFILWWAKWKLREGAVGVPYVPAGEGASSQVQDTSDPPRGSVLYNIEDVLIEDEVKEKLRSYSPVNANGQPINGFARIAMALRAYERGYKSLVWLNVRSDGIGEKFKAKTDVKPVVEGIEPLDGHPFQFHNMVMASGCFYVNLEDAVECPREWWNSPDAACLNLPY